MLIDNKFTIGQMVYLKTDPEQPQRMVTGFVIRKNIILYELCSGTVDTTHYDFEISVEKDVLITTNN